MLPFLKRKEASAASTEIPEIIISENGETVPVEHQATQNDQYLFSNEGFLEFVHSIVIKHLTRMR